MCFFFIYKSHVVPQYQNHQNKFYWWTIHGGLPLCELFIFFYFIYFLGYLNFFLLYPTLLHLPPLRFHCADGCWDRTRDCCNWCIGGQTLATRLDFIRWLGQISSTTRLDLIRISSVRTDLAELNEVLAFNENSIRDHWLDSLVVMPEKFRIATWYIQFLVHDPHLS